SRSAVRRRRQNCPIPQFRERFWRAQYPWSLPQAGCVDAPMIWAGLFPSTSIFFNFFTQKSPAFWAGLLCLFCFEKVFCRFTRLGGDLLSRALRHSTIGAEAFNGRVRNGIGFWALRHSHQVDQEQSGFVNWSLFDLFWFRRCSGRAERGPRAFARPVGGPAIGIARF